MVVTTVLVAVSATVTVLLRKLATYRRGAVAWSSGAASAGDGVAAENQGTSPTSAAAARMPLRSQLRCTTVNSTISLGCSVPERLFMALWHADTGLDHQS